MATVNKTAYAKLMDRERETARIKKKRGKGLRAQAYNLGVVCGGKKRHGGHCQMAAGWGTVHPGVGKCKFHGGSSPNHVKAAATAEYRKLLGDPIDVNPYEAILNCIKIRAGEIEWLSNKIAELEENQWIEDTLIGKQFHLFVKERQASMDALVRYSQIAVSLGIAERVVKLNETYGEMLAIYTKGILDELWPHLDEQGRANAPQIVRRHLIALDGGRVQAELPETTAA